MKCISECRLPTLRVISAAGKPSSGNGYTNSESHSKVESLENTVKESHLRHSIWSECLRQGKVSEAVKIALIGAVAFMPLTCVSEQQAHTSNGKSHLERGPETVASHAGLLMAQNACAAGQKSHCTVITLSHLQNFQNIDLTLKIAEFFARNATSTNITEKLGELPGNPYGAISSQASHVAERSGATKVQRLGGDERIIRPRAPNAKRDEIVWTAWQHADASHKQARDNNSIIYDISPLETPFMTMAARNKATGIFHEWQTDALASAAANRQIEGDDAANGTSTPSVRLGNYVQTSTKYAIVTDVQNAVKKAGRNDEMSYQIAKRLGEIKRDMELALTQNQASSAGGAGTARSSASAESWITQYTSLGTGTAQTTPGYAAGVVAAPTDSTVTGAFVVSALKTMIQTAWTAGGNPGIIMVGGAQKQVVSGFAGIATIYREAGKTAKGTAIVGAADLYVSDFGEHRIVPNRFQRNRTCLILDMDYWAVSYLTPVKQQEIARTGTADKRLISVNFTLESKNAAASAKVTDLS